MTCILGPGARPVVVQEGSFKRSGIVTNNENRWSQLRERVARAITVRNALLGIVGFLVILVVFYGAVAALDARRAEHEAELQTTLGKVYENISRAAQALAAERGVVNVALGFAQVPDPQFAKMAKEARTAFAGYDTSLTSLIRPGRSPITCVPHR